MGEQNLAPDFGHMPRAAVAGHAGAAMATGTIIRKLGFLLLTLPLMAAATTPCPTPERDREERAAAAAAMDDYALAVAAQAASGGTAREIAAASAWLGTIERIRHDVDSPEVAAMQRRAAELAGTDAVAWYLLATACGPQCPLRPAPSERWLALDGDNAAAWADELVRATAAGDEGRARAALARAAGAPRFDWYWSESVAASLAAARAVPMPAAVLREAERDGVPAADATAAYAAGVSMAYGLPATAPLIEACATHPSWRDDCLRLAETMESRGDTVLARGLARAIARRLLVPGSPESAALAERDRRHHWQMFNLGLLAEAEGPSRALARLQADGSEPAALEAQLREAGIALDPPPGWDAGQAGAERAIRLPPPDPAVLEACEPSKR